MNVQSWKPSWAPFQINMIQIQKKQTDLPLFEKLEIKKIIYKKLLNKCFDKMQI